MMKKNRVTVNFVTPRLLVIAMELSSYTNNKQNIHQDWQDSNEHFKICTDANDKNTHDSRKPCRLHKCAHRWKKFNRQENARVPTCGVLIGTSSVLSGQVV